MRQIRNSFSVPLTKCCLSPSISFQHVPITNAKTLSYLFTHHLMASIHQFIKTQNLEDTSVVAMETKKRGKVDIHSRDAGDRRRPQIIPSSIIQRRRKGERRPEVDALVRHSAPSAMETTETCLWLHFDDKELSGDEEDEER